jgi:hypothetical protein
MVLAGAAASATALLPGATSAANPTADSPVSPDLAAALARFRASIPAHFDRTYVENAVVPFFLTSIYEGAGSFNALVFGGLGRVSPKCHTPKPTALG